MPVPDYVVEISFGSSGYVDVTNLLGVNYVQSITLDRGISSQLEDYSAGSISITFLNNARIFDPLNTSSPLWYGAGGYTICATWWQGSGKGKQYCSFYWVYSGLVFYF